MTLEIFRLRRNVIIIQGRWPPNQVDLVTILYEDCYVCDKVLDHPAPT
jgi:hypothetical protein